jgi:predicted amidophosphoribosyltransferase
VKAKKKKKKKKTCGNCGAKVKSSAKFCTACGTAM